MNLIVNTPVKDVIVVFLVPLISLENVSRVCLGIDFPQCTTPGIESCLLNTTTSISQRPFNVVHLLPARETFWEHPAFQPEHVFGPRLPCWVSSPRKFSTSNTIGAWVQNLVVEQHNKQGSFR